VNAAETHEPWLRELLLALLRTSTEVPAGQTQILPGDPRIVRAVDETIAPIVEALGPDEVRRHESGEVAARFGPESEDGLLVQTYIVSQHANLMDDPHGARIVDGAEYGLVPGPCAVGQGATQNKGPMASAFAAVRARPAELARPVWLVVNTEGMSSHAGSRRVLDELGVRAAWGIVAFGTDLRVSLGLDLLLSSDSTISGFLRGLLGGIGPISIWGLAITAIGVATLEKQPKGAAWTAATVAFVVMLVVAALLQGMSGA